MNCNREEDSLMIVSSHSSEPLIEARSFDPINADETQGPVNCGHFSIRGYVSEIRKRDLKNCLPFMMNHEPYNLDKLSSSLPPLQVPDFKWWGCQTCSKTSNTIHAAIKERESTNRFGREAKSDTTCSHRTSIIESRNDSLQLIPDRGKVRDKGILEDCSLGKNISEERHGETMILINSDSGESTSLCCGEDEKDSMGLNLIKEVTTGAIVQSALRMTHSPMMVLDIRVSKGDGEAPANHVNNGSSGAANKEPCGIDLNHIEKTSNNSAGLETNEHMDDICSQRNASNTESVISARVISETVIRPKENELMESGEEGCGNDEVTDDFAPIGRLHHKKSRKVRLLSDILQSEKSGESKRSIGGDADVNNVVAEAVHPKAVSDASKRENQCEDLKNALITGKTNKKRRSKRKDQCEDLHDDDDDDEEEEEEDDDDGDASLIHWLNGEDQGKGQKNALSIEKINRKCRSKRQEVLDDEEDVSLIQWLKGEDQSKDLKNAPIVEKINKKRRSKREEVLDNDEDVSLIHWFKGISKKPKVHKAGSGSDSNLTLDARFGKGMHSTSESSAGSLRNDVNTTAEDKQNEISEVEVGQPSLLSMKKVLLGKASKAKGGRYSTMHHSKEHTKISKKWPARRTSPVPEQSVLDDIPMDIVELMAKNQHERRMSNAEGATDCHQYNSGGATCSTKRPLMDLNEVPQDEAASGVCAGPEQLVSVQGNPRMQSYSNSFENFHTENKNMANSRCINSIQSESCQGNRNSTGQSSGKQAHCLESSINRRASLSGTLSFLDKGKKHHSEVGPSDAYTSDAISAMNLLRLMDPMSSTAPSSAPHVKKKNYNHKELPAYKNKGETNKVPPNAARFDSGGPSQPVRNSLKRLLPRPMVRPSNIAQNGRVEHSEVPHIANNSHSREFLGLEGSGETSMVSTHPSAFHQFSRVSPMGNSFSGYYPIPGQKIGMLGSPLHDISGHPNNFRGFIGRNNIYYGGINFTPQFTNVGGREKYFSMVDNSGFFNINAHAQPVRFHHHAEGSLSALNNGSSSNHSETNTDRRDGTIQPTESSRETETCHLNQNPAEFSLPVMSNAYTISFDDLDPRKGQGIHYPYMHMNNIK